MGCFSFLAVRWERALGEGCLGHLPTHCMRAPSCLSLVAWVRTPPLPTWLIPLPSLHRPRYPPASRSHGPEPRHSHPCATSTVRSQPDLSLSPPMEIKFPGTALSPPLGPFPSLESSSLRKESSSCPSKAPTMPGRGVHFYIGLFKDFCLKDISNVWERG